jgi:hypothetical protein
MWDIALKTVRVLFHYHLWYAIIYVSSYICLIHDN